MSRSKQLVASQPPVSELVGRITGIIETARNRVQSVVDHEMVSAYWEIGREIVEDEQQGEQRAEYGKALIENLARELTARHGKGFDRTNLWNMRGFFLAFPKLDALRRELSWTHYRQLLKINEPQKRAFYEIECATVNWSTREMMNEGDNLPIGILLCETKSDAVVRYTLPEGDKQIFASRYKLYLPSEDELRAELIRDRQLIEKHCEID